MKYKFDLINRKIGEIENDDRRVALEQCLAANPGYTAESYEDCDGICKSIEPCDGCGKLMFDEDINSYDPDQGNSYCEECTGAIVEDRKNYSEVAKEFEKLFWELGDMVSLDDCEKAAGTFYALKELNYSAEIIAGILKDKGFFSGDIHDLAELFLEEGKCIF